MIRTIGLAAMMAMATLASPVAAESWASFSRSDATVYLVDLEGLTPVDGVATTRLARVPAQGEATNLSHETEEVMVRCSDGQSRSGATVTYGADGAETDRYSEDTPWEATPPAAYTTPSNPSPVRTCGPRRRPSRPFRPSSRADAASRPRGPSHKWCECSH